MRLHPAEDRYPCFVAIGAFGSEGLHDLCRLLACFPSSLPAVVLAVLHRPSNRISHLRQVLARRSALPVLIPEEDQVFRIGRCYIGEPAAHLSFAERSRVCLVEGANNKYRNKTVDLLFMSVAAHARTRSIGVVLRGSHSDGSRGLAAIHFAGGVTMVVGSRGMAAAGMPSNATNYDGPIDFIGSVEEIAAEISHRTGALTADMLSGD